MLQGQAPAALQGKKPKTTEVKKIAAYLLLPVIIYSFYGCNKASTCTPVAPSAEATMILTFANAQGMMVQGHSSGIYYEILDPGTGDTPTADSKISVTYKTTLLDGSINGDVVEEVTTPTELVVLNQFIEGWKIGVPLIQEGGRIKMIVPSALIFGCQPHNGLPGNAVLYYDIRLITVE
jgi:FKBP-type peptidyl-prolyl cis-trans isomerase